MPTLTIPAGHIHYEVRGHGYPVLLFAPGFLSSRMERWRTNPAKPGVPQDWLDPVATLEDAFQLIALDVRNAGESRARLGPDDDWTTYTADHLALLDHLGVRHCHVMGACIGVSFALALAQARHGLVTSLVLQNPIGLSSHNRAALDHEFDVWAKEVGGWPEVDPALLPGFRQRMFGNDFLFSVSREFVRHCTIPAFLMPGDDLVHPDVVSAELEEMPDVTVLYPWKGVDRRDDAMRRVREFLLANTPKR
ncbi:MAG TPA: alpha/beta hydrolase [Casimicrobiaceae bacterium]|nr:alpha/beta hydrolase [Casimicrobiaceae bacterium]